MQSEVGDPVTATELVEVVADALAKHAVPAWGADGKTGTCFCSEPINAERPTIHARTRALSAHQARAVLAALTEAGTVEWGVQGKTFVDEDWDAVWSKDHTNRPLTEDGAKNHLWLKSPVPFRVVSRLTLPWTKAVE